MCRPLPLVPIARGYGDCAKLTGPVRQEQSDEKTIDTVKEKLEEFLEGTWPAVQKLLTGFD